MKMRINYLLLLLTAAVMIYGCKKENHEVVPPPEPTSELTAYYDNNRLEYTQNFTIDATNWQTVTGNHGTILSIPADAFAYSNGSTVTGNVNIELIEILHVSDMVKKLMCKRQKEPQ